MEDKDKTSSESQAAAIFLECVDEEFGITLFGISTGLETSTTEVP